MQISMDSLKSILCLSHSDTGTREDGSIIQFQEGMTITVFEEDIDQQGKRDDLIATGTVEVSPDWLQCKGSRWVLRIDQNGVRNESDLKNDA